PSISISICNSFHFASISPSRVVTFSRLYLHSNVLVQEERGEISSSRIWPSIRRSSSSSQDSAHFSRYASPSPSQEELKEKTAEDGGDQNYENVEVNK
ncbi:hypothetical protein PENTCL1PPCAC_6590, partial [Pristionchus entomophagus]